jgi:hypothetical protein
MSEIHCRSRLQTWRVTLTAHDVPPRWRIEARTARMLALDADHARSLIVREAHIAAALPLWKPLIGCSLDSASAEPVAPQNVTPLRCLQPQATQLKLFDRLAA